MFGMGFMEIFLVLIVAVIALGPEKLPGAAVDIVKFFKKFKSSIDDAKTTFDNELNISELKKEADQFRSSVSNIKNIAHLEMDQMTNIEDSVIEKNEKTIEKSNHKEIHQTKIITEEKVSKKVSISLDENKDKVV